MSPQARCQASATTTSAADLHRALYRRRDGRGRRADGGQAAGAGDGEVPRPGRRGNQCAIGAELLGTIVTVTGEVVELQQGHTVECATRKAPGVLDRTLAVAAGGMLGAAAGALIPGAGTVGMMGGAAAGVATVGTTMAVKQHRETVGKGAAQARARHAAERNRASSGQALRACRSAWTMKSRWRTASSMRLLIAAASDSSKPAGDPSYEPEQPQFGLKSLPGTAGVYQETARPGLRTAGANGRLLRQYFAVAERASGKGGASERSNRIIL